MKHQRPLYSKYSCDDKLSIYSNVPKSNYEYKKAISNVKSKYMQEYLESRKISKYNEDKKFDNLLSNYYQDYNLLKNKYNFIDDEEEKDKYDYDMTDEEYFIKRQNIDKIFSGDLFDIQDTNFDITDNLINELPKDNNFSLIKNTQIKDDYDFRLQGFMKSNKYNIPNEEKIEDEENENDNDENNNEGKDINNNNNEIIIDNNENNISENNNIINHIDNDINDEEENKSIGYLEDDNQFNLENNENYLKLNQPGLNEDLPLFSDIISANYNKNYRIPFYEHDQPEALLVEEENVMKPKEEAKAEYDEFNSAKNMNNNMHKDDKNILVLENKNKEHFKLEDLLNSNFEGEYQIPEYKIPSNIKKEFEEDQQKEEDKKLAYTENIKINSNEQETPGNNNTNLPMMNDLIKANNEKIDNKEEPQTRNEENNQIEDKKEPEKEEKPEIKENEENKKIEKQNESYIDEEDKFEKIDVDGLEDDDDQKYNDFDG